VMVDPDSPSCEYSSINLQSSTNPSDIDASMWTIWCKAIAMNVLNMTLVVHNIIGSGSTSIILFMIMNTILYQKVA